MSSDLTWMILPALAALACGWFAGAWFYKRKIDALQALHKTARRTEAEHASQVRRQIGQLQAELAARPPLPAAERAERDKRASAAASAQADADARRAALDKLVPDHGFAPTAVARHGFATTEVMEEAPSGAR